MFFRSLSANRFRDGEPVRAGLIPIPVTDRCRRMYSGILHVLAVVALCYLAFQLHMLPDSVAKVIGRLTFYVTWPLTYWSRRHAYFTRVDSQVFLGAAPLSIMPHVQDLHALGVRAVVNMCDEYRGPTRTYKKYGITQLHLPTIDHVEPSVADIDIAIRFIEEQTRKAGVHVYVHCKSGNGRSAAIAFCWLLYARHMCPEKAQRYLSSKRKVRKALYKQPQILAYYEIIEKRRNT